MDIEFRIDKNSIFKNEEKQFIIDNYSTMNTKEMAKILGQSSDRIRGYAGNKGLKKEKKYRVFSEEEKEYILSNYNVLSNGEIAKAINVTTKQINDFGYGNGLTRNINRFKVDENYFEKINTEEKAYWLGFLYADGCINEVRNRQTNCIKSINMELSLCSEDKQHLIKFNNSVKSNYKIKDKKIKGNYYANRVIITNSNFCKHLINNGCIPRKSLVLEFPQTNIVPVELQNHFIRGYFDGDGCIHIGDSSQVNFIGTKEFLIKMQDVVFEQTGLTKVKLLQQKNNLSYMVSWGGINNIKKWYNFLYKDSTIWLDRKYDKFQEVINIPYGFVYKLTCLIDNREFIGKARNNIFWDNYIGGESEKLKYAVKKYGKQNFKREILESCITRDEFFYKYKYWTEYYEE